VSATGRRSPRARGTPLRADLTAALAHAARTDVATPSPVAPPGAVGAARRDRIDGPSTTDGWRRRPWSSGVGVDHATPPVGRRTGSGAAPPRPARAAATQPARQRGQGAPGEPGGPRAPHPEPGITQPAEPPHPAQHARQPHNLRDSADRARQASPVAGGRRTPNPASHSQRSRHTPPSTRAGHTGCATARMACAGRVAGSVPGRAVPPPAAGR